MAIASHLILQNAAMVCPVQSYQLILMCTSVLGGYALAATRNLTALPGWKIFGQKDEKTVLLGVSGPSVGAC